MNGVRLGMLNEYCDIANLTQFPSYAIQCFVLAFSGYRISTIANFPDGFFLEFR